LQVLSIYFFPKPLTKSIANYILCIVYYTFVKISFCKQENTFVKLGNNLKRCRVEQNDITQQELANAIGVTRLTIHSIEKGKFVPSTVLALKLAKFFGKAVEEIFYLPPEEE
jgi:putative transcriptional regulator